MLDPSTIASIVGVLGLIAGGVVYLIKVERTLSRIDSTLASLSRLFDEFRGEHSNIWHAHTELKNDHHKLENRVGVAETKLEMIPQKSVSTASRRKTAS